MRLSLAKLICHMFIVRDMPEFFERTEKWYPSEYGEQDVLGTLNHLSQDKVKSAAQLITTGRTFYLSHEMYNGMPGRYERHGPFFYLLSQRAYDHRPPFREETKNRFGGALCRLEMVDHLATHVDALNHISFDNKFYNGNDAYEISTTYGTTKLGIESMPPVVTKGVMVDSTSEKGIMDMGSPVDVSQVEEFLTQHDITVEPGDAIFFHTGVGSRWNQPDLYNQYYDRSPGIGMELAKWLAEKKVSITGSDTPATEVVPAEHAGTRLPVHQYLITLHGIRLIDNMNLNELAKEKVYQFMLVLAPLRIRGATASPVSPVAIA